MRESSSVRAIEGRRGAMMKPAGTWRRWVPILGMIACFYLASNLLKNAAFPTVKYTQLGIIGSTEVLIGLSIAVGQIFLFAASLIFLGTLFASLQLFHVGSLSFPSDCWAIAVALSAVAALCLSPWIGKGVEYLSFVHRLELLDGEAEPHCGLDPSDENVEILRLDKRGVDLLLKPRCIVTIRHPRMYACSRPTLGKTSDQRKRRTASMITSCHCGSDDDRRFSMRNEG